MRLSPLAFTESSHRIDAEARPIEPYGDRDPARAASRRRIRSSTSGFTEAGPHTGPCPTRNSRATASSFSLHAEFACPTDFIRAHDCESNCPRESGGEFKFGMGVAFGLDFPSDPPSAFDPAFATEFAHAFEFAFKRECEFAFAGEFEFELKK